MGNTSRKINDHAVAFELRAQMLRLSLMAQLENDAIKKMDQLKYLEAFIKIVNDLGIGDSVPDIKDIHVFENKQGRFYFSRQPLVSPFPNDVLFGDDINNNNVKIYYNFTDGVGKRVSKTGTVLQIKFGKLWNASAYNGVSVW